MHGVEVKKTCPMDFEKIYPLLQEFNSPYSLDDWRRIFLYQWDGAQDYIGFHLEHNGNVVGFMGLIFSHRYKNNRQYRFCNITSWIVKEGYRSATILLVRKLKHFENVIFTGLNPIVESYRLLTMIGFLHYENSYKIIPIVNRFLGRTCKMKVYEQPILLDKLDEENKRIVTDHMDLKCKSILFELNGINCVLIYKITQQTFFKILVKKVHLLYISDVKVFNENIRTILKFFRKRLGLLSAIYVDSRFVYKSHSIFSINREINPPRIYSSQHDGKIDIDDLYSEAVLL